MAKPFSESEFTARWVASQPMVTAYITSVVRDFHEAEDILQQVGVIAFQKREQYDPDRPFYAWAAGIARFELLHWRRDKARNKHVFTPETIERIERVSLEIHDELDARRGALRFCIEQLNPKGRQFIEMVYLQGLTTGQVAKQLGTKPGSIRVALHRVREKLADCVKRRVAASPGTGEGVGHG